MNCLLLPDFKLYKLKIFACFIHWGIPDVLKCAWTIKDTQLIFI